MPYKTVSAFLAILFTVLSSTVCKRQTAVFSTARPMFNYSHMNYFYPFKKQSALRCEEN